jgi:branched-chain amino acid transport system permease protein
VRPQAWPGHRVRLAAGLAIGAAAVLLPLASPGPAVLNVGVFTLMYVGLATAWNIVGGYTGYVSLGHAGFFGIGAYSVGLVVQHAAIPAGYGPFLVVPLGGVAAASAAIPVGWVALRLRSASFVIVTIAFMFLLQILATNLRQVTGGSQGLPYPVPNQWSPDFFEVPYYYAMLALAGLAVGVSWLIVRSRFGLGLLAIRDDEDRALALGIATGHHKTAAFAISAALVGMLGGVYGYYVTYVYPQFVIDPLVGMSMVLMVFLGGMGTLAGPVLGAVLLEPSQLALAYVVGRAQLYLVLYAAIFLVLIRFMPRGIVPFLNDRFEGWRVIRASGASPLPAAGPEEAATRGSPP